MELAAADPIPALARRLVEGLSQLGAEDLEDELTMTFGLTAWLGVHRRDPALAVEALLFARTVVLATSGLDERREPVPLVPRQLDAAAVLRLARYLHGLLARAERARA